MSLLRKVRVLAAKIETTSGTAITTTATDAAHNVYDLTIAPTIEFMEREGQGAFTPIRGELGGRLGTCTFKIDLYSAVADPLWAATFLPACGLVSTADVYDPLSEPPGSNLKTITIRVYENGRVKLLRGCSGNVVWTLEAGKVAVAEFAFTGIWDAPVDVAILAPTYPTASVLRYAAAAMTVGGYSIKHGTLSINMGNEIFPREDPDDASGYCGTIITGRKVTGTIDAEAELIATHDAYGLWLAGTTGALTLTIGSGTNDISIDAPALQFTNLGDGDRNGLLTDDLEFQLNRSAAAGNDEISIDTTP